MLKLKKTNRSGFTLVEVIIAAGIFSMILAATVELFLNGFRWNRVVWDQLGGQSDARKAVAAVTSDARRAAQANTGAYMIEQVRDNEFIFFADIDDDTARERVRYTLVGSTLKKGVTKPSGSPLAYNTSTEMIADVARDVKNVSLNLPVFLYYDKNYTGVEAPLPSSPSTTLVSAVRVQIEIDRNPDKSPVTLRQEGFVRLRGVR